MKSGWSEKLRSWFTRENLIVVVLAGILLLVIAWPTGESDDAEEDGSGAEISAGEAGSDSAEVQSLTGSDDTTDALERYCARQEERLEELLSQVEGVGSAEVMLTVSASRELVVLKNTQSTDSETTETDAQGGTRTVAQEELSESTVQYDTDAGSAPYVVKTLEPEVEGVLVIAEGADQGTVRSEIVRIVQALYGIEANHIQCVKKSE